jgi:hypothetical protein
MGGIAHALSKLTGGGGGIIGKIADPANVFGSRPGGMSIANAIDPGGYFVKEFTGSDFARQAADPAGVLAPGGLFGDPVVPEIPSVTGANAPPSVDMERVQAAAGAERRRERQMRAGRASNILTSSLSAPNIGTKTLLGA